MPLQPYSGEEVMILAMDLGTTMTAASYAHLVRGVVPRVLVVSRWPYQEEAAGDCKFPTVVRYDANGHAVSYGVQALEEVDPGSSIARWFKLHLHSREMRAENNITAPALPPNVSLKKVYSDIMRHTYHHTVKFFSESTPDGAAVWNRLQGSFELVLAIPNGWDGSQQAFLRDAAVEAGILGAKFENNRLRFVSEAEASIHFVMEHMDHTVKVGDTFGVSDMGGSTVDTTVYVCKAVKPQLRLVEATASECVQAGSVFVDRAFEDMLRTRLFDRKSQFCNPEVVQDMVRIFESKTKRRFKGDEDEVILRFGHSTQNESRFRIEKGRLIVSNEEMRSAFEPCVSAIASSILRIHKRKPCKIILAVGGFAENTFLRSALAERVADRDVDFVFTPEPTKKAAAVGASLWRIKQSVAARAARYTYGVKSYHVYNEKMSSHLARKDHTFVDETGDRCLPGFFDVLVRKNQVVPNGEPRSTELHRLFSVKPTDLGQWTMELYATDSAKPGMWAENTNGKLHKGLREVCTLTADLSGVSSGLRQRTNKHGDVYWRIDFSVEVYFGKTAMCAQIVWKERGTIKKGPVSIIPNSLS